MLATVPSSYFWLYAQGSYLQRLKGQCKLLRLKSSLTAWKTSTLPTLLYHLIFVNFNFAIYTLNNLHL